jgi:tetratricopeptide (TPR) repeat protein
MNEAKIRTRHLKYFSQLAEEAESALRGPTQVEWMFRLNDERDNIRAALEWAGQTDVEAGLYLSSWLRRLWENFDLKEGLYYLSNFLQKPESNGYVKARADALYVYGLLLVYVQQFHEARSCINESLKLYRKLRSQPGEIDALLSLGSILFDATKNQELSVQALALAQSLGDIWRQANALSNLGRCYNGTERFSLWEQAIRLFRQSGDRRSLAGLLTTSGVFVMLDGNIELAEEKFKEATQLNQELNDNLVKIALLDAYGRMALILGKYSQAREYYLESSEFTYELGDDIETLWCQTYLAYLALYEGKISEAYDILAKTSQSFHKGQVTIGVIFSLEGMAKLFAAIDQQYGAAQLIGWADALRKRIGDTRPRFEQTDVDKTITVCLEKMGKIVFSDAYDEGQKMTIDEAVKLALSENKQQ